MKYVQPITPTTVRPLRVLGAIAAGTFLVMLSLILFVEVSDRYQLWRAGGVWCATLETDGTGTKFYGAEACGY
ncbi:MAG: hypothetical protein WBG38_20045 [Nodosilinea sp.]